jgi:hypothetical protein
MSRSPQKDRLPRSVMDAVYRTVHDFEGGAEKLALLTGSSAGVIDNKANPNASTPHLPTLPDVMVWQAMTQDFRILKTMANALGHVAIPLPDMSRLSDAALLELFLRVDVKGGEFSAAVHRALSDAQFSALEFARIEDEAFEYVAAILEAMGRIRGLVDG